MKPKFHGLFTLIAAFGALVGVLLWGSLALTGIEALPAPHPPAGGVQWPSEQQIGKMRDLMKRLPELATPRCQTTDALSLALFGEKTFQSAAALEEDPDDGTPEPRGYQLTLTMLSGSRRYCIIDGQFKGEGDSLSEGVQIQCIESRRVLIAGQQHRQWIWLNDPAPQTSSASTPAKGKS